MVWWPSIGLRGRRLRQNGEGCFKKVVGQIFLLRPLVIKKIKGLSDAAMKRIRRNYRFIISFNSALITLDVIGILTPQASALLHNVSTLAVGLKTMNY